MKVVLITAHDYDAPRKTGFFFWAQILSGRGVDVDWLTVGLSNLTFLKKDARQYQRPYNTWLNLKPHLKKFVFCPVVHPANMNNRFLNCLTLPLFSRYGKNLPQAIQDQIKNADVFIVESGAGPMLVPALAKLCPNAKFIYNFSDRFNVVKYHPAIQHVEKEALKIFDMVRVNAAVVAQDFPPGINVQYIPQAIDKELFDAEQVNPYKQPKNAISVGDMLFDGAAIKALAKQFPDWTFHLFGAKSTIDEPLPNVVAHGEVQFAKLVPYMRYADIGLAPYRSSPDADYLSQSSLKMVQYTYCQLPIVAPDFAAIGRAHVVAYDADNVEGTIIDAFTKAISYDRQTIDRSAVLNWEDFLEKMLGN